MDCQILPLGAGPGDGCIAYERELRKGDATSEQRGSVQAPASEPVEDLQRLRMHYIEPNRSGSRWLKAETS